MTPDSGDVVSKASARSVGETVARFVELLGAQGVTVFDVIDQRAAAKAVGLDLRETTLVIFGSPAAGTPVMDEVPLAALDLPLKVLVWADDERGTMVSYTAPAALGGAVRAARRAGRRLPPDRRPDRRPGGRVTRVPSGQKREFSRSQPKRGTGVAYWSAK